MIQCYLVSIPTKFCIHFSRKLYHRFRAKGAQSIEDSEFWECHHKTAPEDLKSRLQLLEECGKNKEVSCRSSARRSRTKKRRFIKMRAKFVPAEALS